MLELVDGLTLYHGSYCEVSNQYCFKTEKALECLEFVEGEKIWLKK